MKLNVLARLEWWWFKYTIERGFMRGRHGYNNAEVLWGLYQNGAVDAEYVRDIFERSRRPAWQSMRDCGRETKR